MICISNFKDIDLGADSAEKDSGLMRYFLKNDSYINLINGNKTIVVGNRGVGKSAIFRYMANAEKHNIVIELTPEEYSYELLSTILKSEKEGSWGKTASYSVAWQYLLYILKN